MPAAKRDEWFRRTVWTEEDRSAFFARLGRSRTAFHKAQYLRIQAYTLSQHGHSVAALELLNLLVTEYAESSQLALAHEHRGSILRAEGSLQAAITAFSAGQQAEVACPTFRTRCSLLLAYSEARAAIASFMSRNPELPFPSDAYHVNLVLAVLAKHDRHDAEAKQRAASALAASAAHASGFQSHPKLGLVGSATSKLHSWLRRWSA
jgi:hypothetical protein